ncbi:sentrin-specific protease 6 isoform X2 [Pelobates cultripes]|uniref:Sentrin-specific protease 6 n=1 Tax=Pelobates cultripes TaxID=61616 RepID=A0AAD1VS06_PELCU|nr:sentrin-specific protease 6 isoform X2 [Pelobates cultripes]
MAGSGESRLIEALDRVQSKKDGGFKNSWTYDNSEENEIDVEKDEAKLLTVEENDGVDFPEHRSRHFRTLGDSVRTYERRGRTLHPRQLRGNAIGANMLGASKKLVENVQNFAYSPGTRVQGRLFHHTSIQQSTVKTAAQRKEYPPHVPKVEIDASRVPPFQRSANLQDGRCDSDMEFDSEVKRKVQQKRRSSSHETDLLIHQSAQKCLGHREDLEHSQNCTSCVKENKTKAKCPSCRDSQRLCKSATSMAESSLLSRPSIHQHVSGEKSINAGLSAKNFYSSAANIRPQIDIILKNDSVRVTQCTPNGKIGLSADLNTAKGTRMIKLRGARSSEPSDPIVLSSDEEDNASTGSTNRIESISPRPADSACSSPAPSSGKVEAALKENSFLLEHTFSNTPSVPEPSIIIPRKAKMKDEFGNSVTEISVKRRKYSPLEIQCESTPVTCESFILRCRNVRIGTFCSVVEEPVVFCLDFIKIRLEALPGAAEGQEIHLKASDLTKSEWCSARKLPVVFFQTIPATCQSLRSHLKMSRDNGIGWYDCRSPNVDEQYIVLIFEDALKPKENSVLEDILNGIGIRNNLSKFLVKIQFEEANGRLVAFTKNSEEMTSVQMDNLNKSAVSETRMKLRSANLQFYTGDEDEVGDTHTVFVGPIEKLIVYPPPPAKGGISVTNEDLHCLNEGEFLNDVIIDFYLKYLILEKLQKDADRIHIFSSFFYKRLNQRERRNLQDTANLTLQQRRHGRVKTWTRHVDIFQKDFIFVPLNEAAHWFLAVICFPGLEKADHIDNPYYQGPMTTSSSASMVAGENSSYSSNESNSETYLQANSSKSTPKKTPNKKSASTSHDVSTGTDESDTSEHRRSPCVGRHNLRKSDQGSDISQKPIYQETHSSTKNVNGITSESKNSLKHADGLHRIQISYSEPPDDLKKTAEEFIDSDDQDNLDESSDDGDLADENCTSEAGKWHLKPTFCNQPCILLMDSLRGPSRSTVVKTLREYLEVEWEVRKGNKRSFSKDVMKGSNPRVPQQNNFSDCGVYILQYVESFFENPILSFDLPMNLTDWFPQQRMKTKREEIRNLILTLHEQQNKGQKDLNTTQPAPQEQTEQFISSGSD